jgi:hypothetical protein
MGTKPSLGKASGFHARLKSGIHERLKRDIAMFSVVCRCRQMWRWPRPPRLHVYYASTAVLPTNSKVMCKRILVQTKADRVEVSERRGDEG